MFVQTYLLPNDSTEGGVDWREVAGANLAELLDVFLLTRHLLLAEQLLGRVQEYSGVVGVPGGRDSAKITR